MATPPTSSPGQDTSTPVLDDQPAVVDLLNYRQYAEALCGIITSPDTRTPFIIGILGKWGSGKTTLMRLLERRHG